MLPTRRERQVAQTRADILEAARLLFADSGYSGTTVAQVAKQAGVSVQTIYDAVGSKASLIASLNDALDTAAGVPEKALVIARADTAAEVVDNILAITRALIETSGPVIRTAAEASNSEPEVKKLLDEGLVRHRQGVAFAAARLAQLGAINANEVDTVSDLLAMWSDTVQWLYLLDRYSWTLDKIEAIASAALATVINDISDISV